MSAQQQQPPASAGVVIRNLFRDHPFGATLGVWGTILAATGGYLYTRQIPTQLKVIQARIIAQAGLIFGAATLGIVAALTKEEQGHGPATSSWKVRTFDLPEGQQRNNGITHAPAAAVAELK